MGKIETAEQRLSELNGGLFQTLASRYVGYEYGIASVHHSGRSFGTVETTIGTPDCFIAKPNGHYIYIECGKRSTKSETLKKLCEDVQHCLDYERDNPNAGIVDEIVCCYGFPRLEPGDLASIKAMDDRVALIGPWEIAEACVTKYPWLANEYLGLSVGSGAFLDVQAFIDKNHNDRYAPDLDQQLIGRERELEKVCEACRRNQAVLLYGPSGCGKTRLALEACQMLAVEQGARLYVVVPTRRDIYEDLEVFLSDDRPVFLFLDDANQLAGLRDVVDFALEKPNLKLVVTCRNYTKSSVEEELNHIKSFREIELGLLEGEDLNRVLETALGINESGSRSSVAAIVKGNLRLAFLLAETGKDGAEIETMKKLLETVYKDKLEDMPDDEQRAISIASILGPHNTEDDGRLGVLLERFGLTKASYISSCQSLYDKELLDATPRFEAVSFEEQNLRDYFLYYSLIDVPKVSLSDLWSMENGRLLCIQSLNTIYGTFRDENTRQKLAEQLEELLEGTRDNREALRVIDSFGLLLGKAGFSRLSSIVLASELQPKESISYSSFDFKESHSRGSFDCLELSALSPFFESHEFCVAAVRLAFSLMRSIRLSDSDVAELFGRRLSAGAFRMRYSTRTERETLHMLETTSLSNDDSAETVCALLFAKGILQDVVQYTRAVNLREFGFGSYQVSYTEEVIDLRSRCIRLLIQRLGSDGRWSREIRKVLLGYRHYPDGDERLSKQTYEMISQGIPSLLGFDSFEECEDVHGFIDAASRTGVGLRDSMLSELGPGKRFAMAILDIGYMPDDEDIDVLESAASRLSLDDWEEFLALLKARDQRFSDLYTLNALLVRVLESPGFDGEIKELLVKGIAGSSIRLSYAIDTCAARCYSLFGWHRGRRQIIEDAPSYLSYWLVCFDQHAIRAGYVPSVLRESLELYGEVLPFETVCEMARIAPDSFATYIHELVGRADMVATGRWCYLPYSLGELGKAMSGECDTPENWLAVAELLCSLITIANQDPSDEVVGEILRKAPSCLPMYFAAIVLRNSYEQPDVPWLDIFEVVGFASAMEMIGLLDGESDPEIIHGYKAHRAYVHLAMSASEGAVAAGFGQEFDAWACGRVSGGHDALVDVIADMITAYNDERRLSMVKELARADIDVSLFDRIAFGFPFNGMSWMGSELPLLRKRLKYCEQVEEFLLEDGLIKYLSLAREATKMARCSLDQTKIREFVDPYLRGESKS